MKEALQAITDMIGRSEKAQAKFAEGTSQHTLQKNRIKALRIASALIVKELTGGGVEPCTKEDLEKAQAPLASLISKSEKARQKLETGSWQHTMLERNLKALRIALLLLTKALGE